MSTSSPGEADFGRALKALLRAAGLTPDGVLIELGDRRALVSRTSLYDWMKNSHLPEDDGPVLEVVYLCLTAARRRGVSVAPAPQDPADWRRLLADAKQARDARAAAASRTGERRPAPARSGLPIRRWNPVALGVHSAIGGGTLPQYVPRKHDDLLRALLDPTVVPSRMVVLRGASSTGKTRAAYEAVRECLPDWHVDYPRTTSILARRLREGFAPRTVVWLDELWQFISPDAKVLAELGDMLTASSRVVVIATLWPAHWAAYTRDIGPVFATEDPFEPDPGERPWRARSDSLLGLKPLLKGLPELTSRDDASDPAFGGIIDVPDRFTEPEIVGARQQGDRAVVTAIAAAEAAGSPGMVTQYLAGVPDLEEHYAGPGADPYGQAVITAAVDAARFGHGGPFPEALLHQAVVGYLDDPLRTMEQERWWPQALRYACRELRGTITALYPVPPAVGTGVEGYRLADYLDQWGRRARQTELGSASLWDALTAHTCESADLSRIGQSAYNRGLYRYAVMLWKRAVLAGGTGAAESLLSLLRRVAPDSAGEAAVWVAGHAAVDSPATVVATFHGLRTVGHKAAASALAARAAGCVSLDDPDALARLLHAFSVAGERGAIRKLVGRLADSAPGSVRLSSRLVQGLAEVGAGGAVAALAGGPAPANDGAAPDHAAAVREPVPQSGAKRRKAGAAPSVRWPAGEGSLDSSAVALLLGRLYAGNNNERATALADWAAGRFPLDDPKDVTALLEAFQRVGGRQATGKLLARRPETQVALGDAKDICGLFCLLRETGHQDVAVALGQRFATHAPMDSPRWLGRLFGALVEAGERETAAVLARRAIAVRALRPLAANMLHTWDGVWLIGEFYTAGEKDAALALAAQVAEEDGPRQPWRRNGVSDLLAIARRMRWEYGEEAAQAVTALLVNDAYVQGPLDDPWRVANNIKWLDRAAATDAIKTLLGRHPADSVSLQDPGGVAELLGALRQLTGPAAAGEAKALLARRPEEHVEISDASGLARLVNELRAANAKKAVKTLVLRVSAQFPVSVAHGVPALLRILRNLGARNVSELARHAVDQVTLTDPGDAAELLETLAELDDQKLTATAAVQAAGQATLDDGHNVGRLLDALGDSGTTSALLTFANRAADAGHYAQLTERGLAEDSKFGREPDGTASRPWRWQDL